MQIPRNDADAEEVVRTSALFRGLRAALASADRAATASAIATFVLRPWSARAVARVLAIASAVHAVLVSFVPRASAPAGRYVFAVGGALAAIALNALARVRESESRSDVRNLR